MCLLRSVCIARKYLRMNYTIHCIYEYYFHLEDISQWILSKIFIYLTNSTRVVSSFWLLGCGMNFLVLGYTFHRTRPNFLAMNGIQNTKYLWFFFLQPQKEIITMKESSFLLQFKGKVDGHVLCTCERDIRSHWCSKGSDISILNKFWIYFPSMIESSIVIWKLF